MKTLKIILGLCLLILSAINLKAQNLPDNSNLDSNKIYVVAKNDGTMFVGKILSINAHEVVIRTKNMGEVAIPKHEIKEIREVKSGEMSTNGEYKPEEMFATRYYYTSNALSLKKGESYILYRIIFPEVEFGITDHFSAGIITSWIATPIIGTAKYTFDLDPNTHFAIGALLENGSWGALKSFAILPFASATFGNKRENITLTAGFGQSFSLASDAGSSNVQPLFSVGGMTKISKKVSFVFEAEYIPDVNVTNNNGSIVTLIPGLRLQTDPNKAFQFGFGGLKLNGYGNVPFIPFPVLNWFHKL